MLSLRLAVPRIIDPAVLAGWNRAAILHDLAGETMGTSWRVRLALAPGVQPDGLSQAIQTRLDRLVDQMSHWRADSDLGRFNRAPGGSWHPLAPEFAHVMAAALDVAQRSRGAFDPAVGVLVDLWGYGPLSAVEPPSPEAVDRARRCSGWQRLAFDGAARRLRQPGGLRLDLSGIAKGFAVDAVADWLGAQGIGHCLVEIGGEFVGRGMRPDGDPWWVELETPDGAALPIRVALAGQAVATSGDYVRGRHTIDPRTGRPVEHALAVSVVHRSAMLADAWATALSASLPREAEALAAGEDLPARLLVREDDAVREWISPALAAMIAD